MVSSPGFQYILGVLPRTILPIVLTYFSLTFAQSNHDLIGYKLKLPTWLILLIALLVRPVFFIGSIFYSRWSNSRIAANNGAVIAPYVQQSPYSIQKELTRMMHGYPCRQPDLLANVFIHILTDSPT